MRAKSGTTSGSYPEQARIRRGKSTKCQNVHFVKTKRFTYCSLARYKRSLNVYVSVNPRASLVSTFPEKDVLS